MYVGIKYKQAQLWLRQSSERILHSSDEISLNQVIFDTKVKVRAQVKVKVMVKVMVKVKVKFMFVVFGSQIGFPEILVRIRQTGASQ